MRIALRALAPLLLLCCSLVQAAPWDRDSVASILSGRQLDPVEGVWQFPDFGAKLLICRESSTTFTIIALDSPRLSIMPGTIIGSASMTAEKKHYDLNINSKALGDKNIKKSHAIIIIEDDGLLRFKQYSTGVKVNLRRLVPYRLRIIDDNDTRPNGLDGAKKVYPITHDNYKPCL